MTTELVRPKTAVGRRAGRVMLPAIIAAAGDRAKRRFVEFFTANIRNPNTRRAYARAVGRFFRWCDERGITLHGVEPVIVAAYIEELTGERSRPTVKQHLAAIKMLFD
jgi:site-specific recombinase XerD